LKYVLHARSAKFLIFNQQHTEDVVGKLIMGFVENLSLFAAMKEFCKSIKN